MNTEADDLIVTRPSAAAVAAAAGFVAAAVQVAAFALRQQPAEHQKGIGRAVGEGRCTLVVQCDLPTGTATVLVDVVGGMATVLARLEPQPDKPQALTLAARALVDCGLATVAPDARRSLLGALADGDATAAVIADLRARTVRVLVHADGWAEHEEVFRIELPRAPAATAH